MNDTTTLTKIINKLGKLIQNFESLSSEDIGYKIQSISYYTTQLKKDNSFITQIKQEFELASNSVIGILSNQSKVRLKTLLNEIHAFFKAYEIAIRMLENNCISEEDIEFYYDPYIDIDSGEVIEELNTHIKKKLYPALINKVGNENTELQDFLVGNSPVFEASISTIQQASDQYYSNMRQKLSGDVEGFANKEEAKRKEFKRQTLSSHLFFTPAAHDISQSMLGNRIGVRDYNNAINLTNTSSRNIISSATLAIQQAATHYNEQVPPWKWEKAQFGSTSISWHNKPSENNLGNLFIPGLGRYGYFNSDGKYDPNAILSLIDDITCEYMDETNLAEYMLRFSKTGKEISTEDLGLKNTNKNKNLVAKINKVFFLTSCAEIWRYRYTSRISSRVTEIAFANAHARVLQLLIMGKLTMQDVFDENADFGLPTGTEIAKPKTLPNIIEKFILINELYNKEEVISSDQRIEEFNRRFPEGSISSFRRGHIRELRDTYDEQKQIEDYSSSDDESNSYLY